jgi:hypothetical protein
MTLLQETEAMQRMLFRLVKFEKYHQMDVLEKKMLELSERVVNHNKVNPSENDREALYIQEGNIMFFGNIKKLVK